MTESASGTGPAEGDHPLGFDLFPLGVLVVDAAARATAANGVWARLTGLGPARSLGEGWLAAVDPLDRDLLGDRLRSAAASRRGGVMECRLHHAGRRWTRWWWHPGADGGLVVCIADIEDDKAREANLWQRATHDALTGLLNRAQLLDLLDRALRRRNLHDAPLAVIYVDLDGFKAVNDLGGHRAGDEVLRAGAERMATAIRPVDIIARVGGDEFAVLCDALPAPEEAELIAARVRSSITRQVEVNGTHCHLSATTGVAIAHPGDTAEGLLARADAAMYAVKEPRGRSSGETAPPTGGLARPAAHEPAGSPPLPDLWSDVVDAVIDRIVGVARLLDAAAADAGHEADVLRQVVDQLDRLVGDLRTVALTRVASVQGPSGPDRSVRRALDALVDAERLLVARWRATAADPRVPEDVKDRLTQGARLARAAVHALNPTMVF